MKIYKINSRTILPISIEECWNFFSNPENLKKITPPEMDIAVTSEIQNKTYQGQIITYKIGILPVIKTTWVTEITHLREGEYFVDEQRFGPYKFWHHQHIFKEVEDGSEIKDLVHYVIPFGFLGIIAHKLFIRRQLRKIFKYREDFLKQKFGKSKEQLVVSR